MSRVVYSLILSLLTLVAVGGCARATPTPTSTVTPRPSPTPTPMSVDTQLETVLGWVPMELASDKVDYAAYRSAAIASGFDDFKGVDTIKAEGYPRFFWGVEPDFNPEWVVYWPQIGIDPYASELGVYSEGTGGLSLDFHVFQGGFEEEQVLASLNELGYKTDSHQGVEYYYFWNDTEKRDPIDHPLRGDGPQVNTIALVGGRLIAAPYIDTLKSVIDLQQGRGESLLDSKPHRTLAEQFNDGLLSLRFVDVDWLTGWGTRRPLPKPSPGDLRIYVDGPNSWGKLSPYSQALLGYQVIEGRDEMVTALYYPDPEAAVRDAAELEKRWDTYLLQDVDPVPLTDFCAPFSTEVVQYSDSSVLIGTCSGVAREGRDYSKAAHLWQDILVNSGYLFLVPDLEEMIQELGQ